MQNNIQDSAMPAHDMPLLQVDRLVASFKTDTQTLRAVDGVSFSVNAGTILGLVGESGCGKSAAALSIMRLLPKPAGTIESGAIYLKGVDLLRLSPPAMQAVRGGKIAMIFQEPMTALNPVHRIGKQVVESFALHRPDVSPHDRETAAATLLSRVGIPDAAVRMAEYPHQISGGMRQRVMIAMALAGQPDLLIADEPTTALDVTIQAQILQLMLDLQEETGMGIIFITHDLGVVSRICRTVAVMYAGQIVEFAPVEAIFSAPRHPYTQGLLASVPRLTSPRKHPLPIIPGAVPDLSQLPDGCRFQNRCAHTLPRCHARMPEPVQVDESHWSRCFLAAAS